MHERVTVVIFLCASVHLSDFEDGFLYLSKRALKHGRRLLIENRSYLGEIISHKALRFHPLHTLSCVSLVAVVRDLVRHNLLCCYPARACVSRSYVIGSGVHLYILYICICIYVCIRPKKKFECTVKNYLLY